ncbi:sensor domain-containing diguanylate cyclase [Rhizobium mayense]|uniref:diguanylate cyclase n=1 Tax=Rhizobium mayense TaxID=1312184 RepID=A0ABT7JNT8_9HYPH|nr:sensor domain-containing diguanylate cyclase [Rhizobium mayense]MDL2398002.1 diguanylate cyclase [Rhizobium mayense]
MISLNNDTRKLLEQLGPMAADTQVLIALYDAEDRLQFANPAFRSAFFIATDQQPLWADIMRCNYSLKRGTVIAAVNFEEWLRSTQSRRGKVSFRAFETDLHDGRWLWMTETVRENGWMLCIASDITRIRANERDLRQDRDVAIKAAQTDELTGVANRRYVMARLQELLGVPAAADQTLGCLAIFDIDNFKYINDSLGHHAGDMILRDFAGLIQAQVRRTDCFGRVGGEEFVLVMPRTSTDEAASIIHCMLAIVRDSRPLPDPSDFSYTFSAGLAVARGGDMLAEVYRRADLALYGAKVAGRDRLQINIDSPSEGKR